ncbi:MAG: hypothetical protein C0453_01285 [Comamonadaceae bacterium]|nr:hypothetical protein [Comamonadaceae bacterium]
MMLSSFRYTRLGRSSLQRLLITVIILTLVPPLILVLGAWHHERARLLSAAQDQVETVTSLVELLERRRYDGARQVLAAIAAAPVVRRFAHEPCNAYMADVQRAFPTYTNLGLIDLEGRIVCSAIPPATGVALADRSYFNEALREPGVSAEHVIGRVTNLRALTFASRIEREDGSGPSGVIFAALDLERAASRLRELKLPDFIQVDVTTEDGIVLASTQADSALLGRPVEDVELRERIKLVGQQRAELTRAEQFPVVRVIGQFRPTTIVLASRLDTARLLEPVARDLQMRLAALALAAALGAALAWRLSHREITAPVASLLSRMRRFGAGEPDEAPPAEPLAGEFAELHREFSRMRRTLDERGREHEKMLDEVRSMQEKVVSSQRISRIGYWEIDLRSGRVGGTSHLAGILGTDIPKTLKDWLMRLPDLEREGLLTSLEKAWLGDGPLDIEYPMQLGSTPRGWVRMRGEVRTAADDMTVQLQGSVQDITERKVAEIRLAAQMGRLQLLHRITRAIGDRLSISDILGIVVVQLEEQMPLAFCAAASYDVHANTILIEQLGARSMSNAGNRPLDVGETIPADGGALSRAIGGELVYEPEASVLLQEMPLRLAKSGLHAFVVVPLRSHSSVSGVILAARTQSESFSSSDCEFLRQLGEQVALALHQAELYSDLHRAYETLQRSQEMALRQERLRALGEMASGIAHDINNAVSPLTLYIESLLKHEGGLSAAGRQKLATMQVAAEGIAQTVERMREFHPAHDSPSDRRQAVMNSTVRQVVELTQARWRDSALRNGALIEIVLDLEPDLPEVQISAGDLRDALVNLVFNAVDAMPSGGTLTFRTRRADVGSGPLMAEVSVVDSGIGMTEETRRQCLDPFFSTKGGRGTGLGLAMVFATVQRHHGHLEILSAPGQGTTVRLQLPVQSAPLEGVSIAAAEAPHADPLRLLLVDDDPLVLFPLADALRDEGHDVSTAEGGREAIDLFRSGLDRGCPFSAVITDLGMASVDGSRVAREVKALLPSTLVVMLTGWGRRMTQDGGLPPFVDSLLSKPPRLDEVRAALRSARPTMLR